jgi:hypothetical protein
VDCSDNLTAVPCLRAALQHAARAPVRDLPAARVIELLTTGHGLLLSIEAELSRNRRTVDALLAGGRLDDISAVLGRRRALRRAAAGLRGDLRALGGRRAAGTFTARAAGAGPRRGLRRPAS